MNILGRLKVTPRLPESLQDLNELASNLWWTWSPDARDIFRSLDPELWLRVDDSPMALLRNIGQDRLDAAAQDREFLKRLARVMHTFRTYMARKPANGELYAYFCAEYGWHESIQVYSGGLGVLAGDHTKAASDLGLPLHAVGLWYPEGYFHQRVAGDGSQEAHYELHDPDDMPVTRASDDSGKPVTVTVGIYGRNVAIQAYHLMVGHTNVWLLDTDIDANSPEDRKILARLYGGDSRTRIAQEMVLGIGGVRMLRALGIQPTAWHMNEGHSAFMFLERCRELVQKGLTFAEAREAVSSNTLFTVHTPVAAGNDAFDFGLVSDSFRAYHRELGLSEPEFMDLARADHGWGDAFSMTALALRAASGRNGVAELHGETSRRIWASLWPGVPVSEVPITHVTNGVHRGTWMARDLQDMLDRTLPEGWREAGPGDPSWDLIREIDDSTFWEMRMRLKTQSVRFLRRRASGQLLRQQLSPVSAETLLDPHALTIGFARRFATYKRATLIFRDLDRLERLLHAPDRPVQLVFAGKAHPADMPGQQLIREIQMLSQEPRFRGRIHFVEDYDMAVGRALTRGVDVWLNNPRRPLEASGTSGEKAAMNGVLNLSVLDGWWPEGFDGSNGWAFGMHGPDADPAYVDAVDADTLYRLLETEVVPLFYERDESGIPVRWLARSRNAMATIAPGFSARRMVQDYVDRLYQPAAARGHAMAADGHAGARSLAAWRSRLAAEWPKVRLTAQLSSERLVSGDAVTVTARLEHLPDETEVAVDLVYGAGGLDGETVSVPLERRGDGSWEASFSPAASGELSYGVRARPVNSLLASPADSGFNTWAHSS